MENIANIANKNKFGEVLTPSQLINEILDQLPSTHWTNPDLKWLDPCAGTGNFFTIVLERLMQGLSKKIPNTKRRITHIKNTMLYMCELNPTNVDILTKTFNNTRVFSGDYLSTNTFGMQFDVILGNPPYQVEKQGIYKGSQGNAKTLWDKFIVKSLADLKEDGLLGYITPANWRRPEHSLYSLICQENTLKYLHIYSKYQGRRIFDVGTRFDVYVVQKTPTVITENPMTEIVDEKGERHEINVLRWPFLPNYCYTQIWRILAKKRDERLEILFNSSMYDARKLCVKKTAKCKYPVVHTMTKKGLGLRYTGTRQAEIRGQAFPSKVLLNFNERLYPYNDYKGEYGMSQLTFGILIRSKSQGDQIVKSLLTPEFQEIIKATKWSSFQTDYRMFRYFKRDFYEFF